MAMSEKVAGGARVAWAQMAGGGEMEGCSGLAPIWHLFEVQMTGLKRNVEFINFKNGCQGMVLIFAAEGHFRSPFRSYEMKSEGRERALVCQGLVSQLRNPLRNGAMAVKMGFSRLWGFRRAFRSYEMRRGCEMALVCQGVVS